MKEISPDQVAADQQSIEKLEAEGQSRRPYSLEVGDVVQGLFIEESVVTDRETVPYKNQEIMNVYHVTSLRDGETENQILEDQSTRFPSVRKVE